MFRRTSVLKFMIRKSRERGDSPFRTSLGPDRISRCSPSSRLHVILGTGCPFARHTRVAFSPSRTVTSELVSSSIMSGGTANKWEPVQVSFRGSFIRDFQQSAGPRGGPPLLRGPSARPSPRPGTPFSGALSPPKLRDYG